MKAGNNVRLSLGSWQSRKHRDRISRVKSLVQEIVILMNACNNIVDAKRLLATREELANLYNSEEVF